MPKILFYCERYPEYCVEGHRFKDHKLITDDETVIDKVRKSYAYRGYIVETEIIEQDSPPPDFSEKKVTEQELKEIEKKTNETTRRKRGKPRQGAITTAHLRNQV